MFKDTNNSKKKHREMLKKTHSELLKIKPEAVNQTKSSVESLCNRLDRGEDRTLESEEGQR